MQDLKTGHLLGASPRAQFKGQLIGSALSILVTSSAYSLYTRAYPIPGPDFPAPTAYVWLSLARLLRDGALPPQSGVFMVIFGILAIGVAALKIRATKGGAQYAKYIPSGIAFAVGFLNTPSFSIARLIGGLIEFIYHRRRSQQKLSLKGEGRQVDADHGIGLVIIASGFVLGEGVVSIVGLVLKTFGVGVISCWGCLEGVCGSTC